MNKDILELRNNINTVSDSEFPNLFLAAGYLALYNEVEEKSNKADLAFKLTYSMDNAERSALIKATRKLALKPNELVEAYYELLMDYYPFTSLSSLDEIIYNILDIKDNTKILDYCCGYGSFLKSMSTLAKRDNKKIIVEGIELNFQQATITELVMDLLGIECKVSNYDALRAEVADYDIAFTIPPMKVKYIFDKCERDGKELFNSRTSAEWVFINRLLDKLSDNGRIVAIIPDKPLHSLSDMPYRRYLLENNLVEAVVALPQGLISGTNISMNMLILSHNNKRVRVKDFANKFSKADIEADGFVSSFLEEYNNPVGLVHPLDCIVRGELIPYTLLDKEIILRSPRELSEVARIRIGSQYTTAHFKNQLTDEDTGWYLLTPGDINDGEINYSRLQKINPGDEDGKLRKHCPFLYDIVLTSKSSTLKVAIMDKRIGNLVVTGGMFIISPKLNEINPIYLKLFLDSDKGHACLDRIKKGAVIKSIDKASLEGMSIEYDPMEVQNKLVEDYRLFVEERERLNAEIDKINRKIDSIKNSI